MTVRDEILALKNSDGLIVPAVVLEWARRHQRSALHQAINWDPNFNIENYLLLQVRNLITLNIRDERKAPEMISLSIDRRVENGGYREISDVLAVPKLRQIMLEDALHELDLLQRRFAELTELAPIWEAVERVRRPPPPRSGRGRGGGIQPTA
jgi:hypothetical protein